MRKAIHSNTCESLARTVSLVILTVALLTLAGHSSAARTQFTTQPFILNHAERVGPVRQAVANEGGRLSAAPAARPSLPAPSPQPVKLGDGTYELRDYGAMGDGRTSDSAAVQAALDALIAGGGGTLRVGPGHYLIDQGISANLAQRSVVISGTGGDAQFVIATGGATDAFDLAHAESLLIEKLIFVSADPRQINDANRVLFIRSSVQAVIRDCQFYGLATINPGTGVVQFNDSNGIIENTQFRGCTGNSARGVPVVSFTDWYGAAVRNVVFLDYGTLNGTYWSKTPQTAAHAWITFGVPARFPPTASTHLGTAIVDGMIGDEGAHHQITIEGSSNRRVHHAVIRNVRSNITGISSGTGVTAIRADKLTVEDSWFGFQLNGSHASIVALHCGDILINRVLMAQNVTHYLIDGSNASARIVSSSPSSAPCAARACAVEGAAGTSDLTRLTGRNAAPPSPVPARPISTSTAPPTGRRSARTEATTPIC
ncbi:MAG: glycosyl hydrolase family 28-related protein [Pyrinomonadaceae bacterium]